MDKAQQYAACPRTPRPPSDLADMCDRFEKKLYDLELTRNVSIQMGAADPPDPVQRHA